MIETLNQNEYELFLWLNGHHSAFFDSLMYWVSHKFTFIPLYLVLIYLIFKKNQPNAFQKFIFVIISVGVSDRFTSGFMKPYFKRLRPCHDELINKYVHLVGDCGGQYGFVSSHASNSFALATAIFLLFSSKKNSKNYLILLYIWAALVAYSRVYNGVHYLSDVLLGAIIGVILTIFIYFFVNKLTNNLIQSNKQ